MKNLARIRLLVACTLLAPSAWAASPCDGVSRALTNERKATLAPAITKQLKASLGANVNVHVLESFQFGGWSIIYVATGVSDDAFLFYATDPLKSRPITIFGGVATRNEEPEIRKWAIVNAPGIPPKLASCFAWHVTQDRGE